MTTQRQVSVERTIAAPPSTIFAVLTNPAQHAAIDGSRTLRGTEKDSAKLSLDLGSTFFTPMTRWPRSMHMTDLVQAAIATACRGRMRNTVVEFVANERIAWRNFGRHIWRYELHEVGPQPTAATLVRETFDYEHNITPALLEIAGFPKRSIAAMTATLHRLDRLCTSRTEINERSTRWFPNPDQTTPGEAGAEPPSPSRGGHVLW